MPNYAIVIGINSYPGSSDFGPLSGPVGGAIRMMGWLLDPANEHGVAEGGLILLLGPDDAAALGAILDGMGLPAEQLEGARGRLERLEGLGDRRAATFDQINQAVREVHDRAGDEGERLYFYYSGHGLSAALDGLGNDVEDAIVPADRGAPIPKRAISIPSITRTLLAASFREQFFFFDCCRNQIPGEDVARIDRLKPNRRRVPTDQYIYSATALGLKASARDGLFSDMLLRGLAGEGSAKAFSPQGGAYEVRSARLFQYLRRGFESLERPAFVDGGAGVAPQPQRPRLGGDHGGDPVLKTLDAAGNVDLRVAFETPAGVAAGARVAEVRVFGEGLAPEAPRGATAGTPVSLSLSPRSYFVQVVPERGLSGPPPAFREVYDDPSDLPVKLVSALVEATPRRGTAPEDDPAEAVTVVLPSREALEAMAAPGVAPAAPARISITADDPLAPIELLDSAGNPARDPAGRPFVGLGALDCPGLAPGVYRARMRSPEGEAAETVVAPGPGQVVPIRLRPPRVAASGLVRRLAEAIDPASALGRLADASGRVESVAMPAASTLIALAGRATDLGGPRRGVGGRLRDLGLRRLLRRDDAPGGIRIFVGGEVLAPAPGRLVDPALAARLSTPEGVAGYLDDLEVRAWPTDGRPGEARRLERADAVAAVSSLAWPIAPGPCRLSIGGPAHGSTTFELVVLEGRTTELIVHQGPDGRIDVSLFMPRGRGDALEVRLIDLLQRFLRNGDARFGAAVADRLFDLPIPGAPLDPVAGMLGGLLFLRDGRFDALAGLAGRLASQHPGLPDGHALLGLGRMRGGDAPRARRAFAEALAHGLPLLAPVLQATSDAVESLGLTAAEAPRSPLLTEAAESLIPGQLWSARRPRRPAPAAGVAATL